MPILIVDKLNTKLKFRLGCISFDSSFISKVILKVATVCLQISFYFYYNLCRNFFLENCHFPSRTVGWNFGQRTKNRSTYFCEEGWQVNLIFDIYLAKKCPQKEQQKVRSLGNDFLQLQTNAIPNFLGKYLLKSVMEKLRFNQTFQSKVANNQSGEQYFFGQLSESQNFFHKRICQSFRDLQIEKCCWDRGNCFLLESRKN